MAVDESAVLEGESPLTSLPDVPERLRSSRFRVSNYSISIRRYVGNYCVLKMLLML